jgi:cysteine-rich repeat protein
MNLHKLQILLCATLLFAGCPANFDYDFGTQDGGDGGDGGDGEDGGDSSVPNDVSSQDCGNGILESGEDCDDGNRNADDGCSAACSVEAGWSCSGSPSVCIEGCGENDSVCVYGSLCCSGLCVAGTCQASCVAQEGEACSDDSVHSYQTDGVCDAAGACYSQILITAPNDEGMSVDTGTEIAWTNDAVPAADVATYTIEYSDDSGQTWTTLVSDYGLQDQNTDGAATWQVSSTGTESHPFEIALPKVAHVVEATLQLVGIPDTSVGTDLITGSCDGPITGVNLISDAQTFADTYVSTQKCDAPNDTENAYIGSGYATFRYLGVNLLNDDVDVDVTTYRQQINGVVDWGVYASDDNSTWSLCGALIPGQDGYNSFARTCAGFTGTDLYVRISVETAGSNIVNAISAFGVSYPAPDVSPSDVSLSAGSGSTVLFSATGAFDTTTTTTDFAAVLNAHLDASTAEAWETVSIPFDLLFTDASISVGSIAIEYTDYYWNTDQLPAGTTYRVRVMQQSGTGSGGTDINDFDLQIQH